MDDPIKIIYKYKNKQYKTQYNVCIYVGNIISTEIQQILKKIKDLNLFDTLLSITLSEYAIMEKKYGNKWYYYFFNSHHITATIAHINATKTKKDDFIDKYGEEWCDIHFIKLIITEKIHHNYAYAYNERHQNKQQSNFNIQDVNDYVIDSANTLLGGNDNDTEGEIENYINSLNNISHSNTFNYLNMSGGNDDNTEEEIDTTDDDIDTDETDEIEDTEIMEIDDSETETEDNEENIDINNMDLLQLDENAQAVTDEINNIIKNKNTILNTITEFTAENETYYDVSLKDVFSKTYIYNQYIYKDDTIQLIKNKIMCGITLDNLFSGVEKLYILPSRMYLWSEYDYEEQDEIKHSKIMLGQKWLKRNEILNINIEPEAIKMYEQLKGNLKQLKEDMLKYGSRIKKDLDENNILDEYASYITNNEIYMIDVYHELGLKYVANEEILKNIYTTYIKIYFNITQDELQQIIDFLNNSNGGKVEKNKILQTYININNDLLLENEVTKKIEELKTTPEIYKNIFKDNYVIQCVIHISLHHKNISNTKKIDLFRIFDNFTTSEEYPFLQYQTIDGKMIYKILKHGTENDKNVILSKWLENSPYGISFKIKVEQKGDALNKYISINLNENGQLEYKNQWKEQDQATITDIKNTYKYVRNLLDKINNENDKLQIIPPIDDHFRFAFINTMQQIELPNKYIINHNDLSDFARYFYPFISVVIEPRKRQSKIKSKKDMLSKYGTYLRYNRISKYINESRIEHRILYFLKNYEYVEHLLTSEISKQFNITEKQANEKILFVKQKFVNLKKMRKVLKKFENLPKYKPPGINIDIQGKLTTTYKMRVAGARNKFQLDKIINFMNILIYLYIETYHKKNPDMFFFSEKLKKLNNIAKRRHLVADVVQHDENIKSVKQITKLDSERLAYKPNKGEKQWTRDCQNSGDDKKRRPLPYNNITFDEMIKQGYSLNTKTGDYERTVKIKKKEIVLQAAKLTGADGSNIYYTCGPEENGKHMYVGFLSNNPNVPCRPCCFKKTHYLSTNKEKHNTFMRCVGKQTDVANNIKKINGEKLYILQDSNKIQEGRFAYLPKYLNLYFNTMLNKTKVINKNNYLVSCETGYFFKFGSVQSSFPYLHSICSALDITIDTIKLKIKNALTSSNIDKNLELFTYLNNGDIRTQFGTIENFLYTIDINSELNYLILDDLLSIPNVLDEAGINFFIFENKKIVSIEENVSPIVNEDFILICKNIENIDLIYDTTRKNIFLLKEDSQYHPIYMTLKKETSKTIDLLKVFYYENIDSNIVNHVSKYISISCSQTTIDFIKTSTAKFTFSVFEQISDFQITSQIIDRRNKSKYLILNNKIIFPIRPSGSILNIPISSNLDIYINTIEFTIENLMKIHSLINTVDSVVLYCKPIGFMYDSNKGNAYHIIAIIIEQSINIPVQPVDMQFEQLKSIFTSHNIGNFILESRTLYDIVDTEIERHLIHPRQHVDPRVENINFNIFNQEHYELFRFEFSNFISAHSDIYLQINKILEHSSKTNDEKKFLLKKIIYKLASVELYNLFRSIDTTMNGGSSELPSNKLDIIHNITSTKHNNFISVIPTELTTDELIDYKINNNRSVCKINVDKHSCSINKHCKWSNNSCMFAITKEKLIMYVNKIVDELVYNEMKSNEIMQKYNSFVPDVINIERYKNNDNQKIIKSININITKILSEIFGNNNIPQIGKKRNIKMSSSVDSIVINNPLEKSGNVYIQSISAINAVFRAYVNCFYWLKNTYSDISYRNLGFYNQLQSDLVNLFKSFIIDYLQTKKRVRKLISDIGSILSITEQSIPDYLDYFIKSNIPKYISILDLYILNQMHHIPIIVYNSFDNVVFIIDNGVKYISSSLHSSNTLNNNQLIQKYTEQSSKYINIKYISTNPILTSTISTVYAMYFI